jgi:hypothetical protein
MKGLGLNTYGSSIDETMSILKMNYLVYGKVVEDHRMLLRDALADGLNRVRSLAERRARQCGRDLRVTRNWLRCRFNNRLKSIFDLATARISVTVCSFVHFLMMPNGYRLSCV